MDYLNVMRPNLRKIIWLELTRAIERDLYMRKVMQIQSSPGNLPSFKSLSCPQEELDPSGSVDKPKGRVESPASSIKGGDDTLKSQDGQGWWVHIYAEHIYSTLQKHQELRIPYGRNSPQLEYRRYLVDFMGLLCEKLHINIGTQHLAVYLMDHFMDNHSIADTQLHLTCLVSLQIAAKSEELDRLIPTIDTLSSFVQYAYGVEEFKRMELTVLKFYKWNLNIPTAAHFINYYLHNALDVSDIYRGKQLEDQFENAEKAFERYTKYFLEISLQEVIFLEHTPATVSACCVLASRKCMNIQPLWPRRLEIKTGKSVKGLAKCGNLMLNQHDRDEQAEKTDEIQTTSEGSLPSNLYELPTQYLQTV
ncbi:cyclin-J-like [Oopsacas minuta]|uniref:Cyclin-J-like n=1 Tax=Oopsacas minuta TaxID=111878 RepID=A0AAV7K3H8_9METZ|nr:cyclin-J-like [Oopsacas minuta]